MVERKGQLVTIGSKHGSLEGGAGVVDKYVEPVMPGFEGFSHALYIGHAREITQQMVQLGVSGLLLQFCDDAFGLCLVASYQGDSRAALGELCRCGLANAIGRTCY